MAQYLWIAIDIAALLFGCFLVTRPLQVLSTFAWPYKIGMFKRASSSERALRPGRLMDAEQGELWTRRIYLVTGLGLIIWGIIALLADLSMVFD